MVPEIVRLERPGMCDCGELVAAGQRAGYAAPQERVVCLACLSRLSASPGPDDAPRSGTALLPLSWTADEAVIAATPLRGGRTLTPRCSTFRVNGRRPSRVRPPWRNRALCRLSRR